MQDLQFDSDSLGETQQFLVRAYANMRICAKHKPTHAHIERKWLGAVSMDRLEFNYEMTYEAAPLGRIRLCRVHTGRIEQTVVGESRELFTAGEVALLSPPELPFSGRVHQSSYDLTMFDPALLDRVAGRAPDRGCEAVRLIGHRPISQAAGRQLDNLIGYLREHVLDDPAVRDAPLVASTAAQHLAACVLNTFPNNALREPTAVDRHDSAPALFRRAVAFIEENPHRDIALADIAAAVYVSPRAVQYMFRRHFEMTPMQYLRRVRLHHAHQDLVAANRLSTTVTTVATKWGFAHTGRFAVLYRQTYGRSPHQTLRNGA